MPPIINFKICDNSPECSGIEICPVKAMSWDDKKETIVIDEEKCIGCRQCIKACPIGAIKFFRTPEEKEYILSEFDREAAFVGELFVDRYGATPVGQNAGYKESDIDPEKLSCERVTAVELFDPARASCLRASVPIKNILSKDIGYFKAASDGSGVLCNKFGISELPALLLFKRGVFLGKIEGTYDIENEDALKTLVDEVLQV